MSERYNWAILGTGNVANRFAKALQNISDQAEMVAVGSRNQDTAAAFAEKFDIPAAYGSYQAVADDPNVDIVYIGTPHPVHHRDAKMCLDAGKHVLCEKAFTMNAGEAMDLINLAREKGLFLMEAMWTRFFPVQVRVREILAAGTLGELQGLVIHHNYVGLPELPDSYPDELGMGTFMDQAPYGMGFAFSVLDQPLRTTGFATFGTRGLNLQVSGVFEHDGGKLTTWMASRTTYDVKGAIIFGSEGKIDIHAPWYKPTAMTLHVKGKDPEFIEFPLDDYVGYEYEAMEVMNCIREGKIESEIMPLDETLAIMKTMDSMRAEWGFGK
jgi:predicted dehydrogenase